MLSLESKALDFVTITTDIEKCSLRRFIKKLEAIFGVKELQETSKAKFRQASQRPEESLEDWADCVMNLVTPAFVDLPEDHLKKRLLLNLARVAVTEMQPSTIDEALNLVKHHQFTSSRW